MAFKLAEGWDLHSGYPITQIPDRLSLLEQKPPMRIKPVLVFLSCIFLQTIFIGAAWSQTQTQQCDAQLSPLKKTKNAIIGDGGMWALFEHNKVLQEESSKAIQLDSKIQQLIWLLGYLCQTAEGVPLNELATYLTKNLKEKSKPQFKQELIILGKTEAEIDIWFVFSDVSLKNETRQLDLETVYNSIQKSLPLLLEYKSLAEEVDQSPNKEQIESVNNLYQKIEQLESSDPYLAQSLLETSQVPHWDIDESTGGS
jgi:hypothetical protein